MESSKNRIDLPKEMVLWGRMEAPTLIFEGGINPIQAVKIVAGYAWGLIWQKQAGRNSAVFRKMNRVF